MQFFVVTKTKQMKERKKKLHGMESTFLDVFLSLEAVKKRLCFHLFENSGNCRTGATTLGQTTLSVAPQTVKR
jgi:hypothetical protein